MIINNIMNSDENIIRNLPKDSNKIEAKYTLFRSEEILSFPVILLDLKSTRSVAYKFFISEFVKSFVCRHLRVCVAASTRYLQKFNRIRPYAIC